MPEATPAGITKVHLVDATGTTVAGTGGGAMTVADGADVTQGAKADSVWDGVAASASVVAILKKIATSGASAGLTDTQLRASAVPVSLASTTITGSVAVTGPLTDAQLRASAVPVSLASTTITGTVTSDTELPAAAALSDTDANPTAPYVGAANMGWNNTNWVRLKAGLGDGAGAAGFLNIVPMMFNGTNYDRLRGDLTNGLKVQGTVTATGPLTDTQLRASAVPVSLASTTITGSVAVTGPLTDTQLRASAVPVDVSDRAARLVVVEIPLRRRAGEFLGQQRHQRRHVGLFHHL